MSGIYIKNIEMPAPDKYVEVVIFGDGKVLQTGESWKDPENGKSYYTTLKEEKHFDAVFVPPHGRLGDLDALEQDAQKRLLVCTDQFQRPYEIMRAIALAPTIIPAEEGE